MGFGGTTEKLQKVASMAEDVYAKLNELRDQIQAMRETVERVDRRTAENRALLEAIAAEQDVDVDAVLTETAIEEAEDVSSTTESSDGATTDDATADATSPDDGSDGDATAAESESTTTDAATADSDDTTNASD
jgi:nitrogen fixation/metabolism regulation signal transduction histidine kinase